MEVEELADRLIDGAEACSSSEVGAVYRFLLSALGGDEGEARAEFLRYLKGEVSPQMLRLARSAAKSAGVYPFETTACASSRRRSFLSPHNDHTGCSSWTGGPKRPPPDGRRLIRD